MSLSQNPLMGHMSGSMANFSTYTLNGKNVVRSKAFQQRDAHSDLQMAQRASFKLIKDAYESFGGITKNAFPDRPASYSVYNAFMTANLPAAIDKSSGIPVIDYSKLAISRGTLLPVIVSGATTNPAGISLTYETNTAIESVHASDQVIAVAKTKIGELIVARQVRGSEAVGTILLPYPGISAPEVECCYLYVLNAQGTKVSDSTYVSVE